MSGRVIGNQWCFQGDPCVKQERDFLEHGEFEHKGCPAVKRDELTDIPDELRGIPLQRYRLFYGETELMDGRRLSEYEIPNGAFIDVLVVDVKDSPRRL